LSVYLDTSALVKLVVPEAETEALQAYLDAHGGRRVSSALARVELVRSVRRVRADLEPSARLVLRGLDEIDVDRGVREQAATLRLDVRSLDAIHLACALRVSAYLTALVTYDRRMAVAADALGLPVAAPG
jgi:predicted nucleic acid-binding protein